MESQPRKTDVAMQEMLNPHKEAVARVKQAYDDAIEKVFEEMGPENLKAFIAVQKGHGDTVADTKALINNMREKMFDVVMKMNKHFFESNEVETKLLALELLKERFGTFEGREWNVNDMLPNELTRHVRIQILDSSIRYLERKLAPQKLELEAMLAESKATRARIQEIQNERVRLTAFMERQMEEVQAWRSQEEDLREDMGDRISRLPRE